MSGKKDNSQSKLNQAADDSWPYYDADNWTPEQAAQYAEWLHKIKQRQLDSKKTLKKRITAKRPPDLTGIEADILSGLNNAVRFAHLAEGHAEVFDPIGFVYDLDEFITHAKIVSDYVKKYKKLLDFEEAK
jgi:hypothetical protein